MNCIARPVVFAITAALILSPSAISQCAERPPLIRVENRQIVLENDVGCKLVIHEEHGRYGLGTFHVKGVALGPPIKSFLTEDNVGNNARDTFQRLWPGQWTPEFRPTEYEIVQNGPDRGVIKFSGREGKFDGAVTITLCHGQTGYRLDYDIAPRDAITHPVFACAPLWADKMQFVQFPFENPLLPTPPRSPTSMFHPPSRSPRLSRCSR